MPSTALGLVIALAAVAVAAEAGLAILLWKTHPQDPLGGGMAALMVVALLTNFGAGLAAARAVQAERRREADLAAELARLMLHAADLRSALDRAGERLAQALKLRFARLELEDVTGDEGHSAITLRDGETVLGALVVPTDLPRATQQRLRQRVVPSLEALLAAAHDREQINEALTSSREALERFFALSSDMLCITRRDRVIMVNPAFERTLGYTFAELESRRYLDVVAPEDRDRARAVLDGLSGGDEPARYEIRAIRNDGSRRWIEWAITSHRGVFYIAGRDVTDRRREQDQLRQAQAKLEALAEQQSGLRRVATLVAQEVSSEEVFSAVADEMGRCLNVAGAAVSRYDGDTVAMVALASVPAEIKGLVPLGERLALAGDNVHTRLIRTGRAARMDSQENATGAGAELMRELGVQSIVAVPIVVGGGLWGAATAGSVDEPMPPDTEARMADFAELVSTAIANATARAELQASRDRLGVLATQQSALRRVATLVARGVSPSEVFAAVAEEMARCLNVHSAEVFRYEVDGAAVVVVASYAEPGVEGMPVGERVTLEGDNIAGRVFRAGRTARMDSFDGVAGAMAARMRELGMHSRVGAPIVVDECAWGLAVVGSARPEPLPPDTEERIAEFADLIATAIAASTTSAELIASRARIVAAADDARRRLERDLHDGAQQRLVSLGMKLRMAQDSVPAELDVLNDELSDVLSGLGAVSKELQEISRGIHPAVLSRGGLAPALKALARRSAVPVSLDVVIDRRLPEPIEVAAYYVVAEALANTAKYAKASEVNIRAQTTDAELRLTIRDDGIGGADSRKGSGLVGLNDRIEAIGGQLRITSNPGHGTALDVTVPLGSRKESA